MKNKDTKNSESTIQEEHAAKHPTVENPPVHPGLTEYDNKPNFADLEAIERLEKNQVGKDQRKDLKLTETKVEPNFSNSEVLEQDENDQVGKDQGEDLKLTETKVEPNFSNSEELEKDEKNQIDKNFEEDVKLNESEVEPNFNNSKVLEPDENDQINNDFEKDVKLNESEVEPNFNNSKVLDPDEKDQIGENQGLGDLELREKKIETNFSNSEVLEPDENDQINNDFEKAVKLNESEVQPNFNNSKVVEPDENDQIDNDFEKDVKLNESEVEPYFCNSEVLKPNENGQVDKDQGEDLKLTETKVEPSLNNSEELEKDEKNQIDKDFEEDVKLTQSKVEPNFNNSKVVEPDENDQINNDFEKDVKLNESEVEPNFCNSEVLKPNENGQVDKDQGEDLKLTETKVEPSLNNSEVLEPDENDQIDKDFEEDVKLTESKVEPNFNNSEVLEPHENDQVGKHQGEDLKLSETKNEDIEDSNILEAPMQDEMPQTSNHLSEESVQSREEKDSKIEERYFAILNALKQNVVQQEDFEVVKEPIRDQSKNPDVIKYVNIPERIPDENVLRSVSIKVASFVLIVALIVICLTSSYPHMITPKKMKLIAEEIVATYEARRARDREANINQIQLEVRRAVDEERRRRLETKVRRRDIAKLIYNSVYSTETTERDLTAADELVRGLTFDKYEENAVSQVFIGIKTSDFDQLVNRLTKRHSIPSDKKDGILDGKFADQNTLKIKEFVFNVGSDSKITYCKIATIKTSETHIDMALMLFNLDFKLTPTVIETVRQVWFLWFIPWGTEREVEIIERNLSELDQNKLINFFRAKALQGFTKEYPSVTEEPDKKQLDY